MQRTLLAIFFLFAFVFETNAQFSRYIVVFKNKAGNIFTIANPSAYLSQAALDRRTRYGISIDSVDLPVTPSYIAQLKSVANVTVLNASKWLNQVSIQTTDANAINTIRNFSFVKSVDAIAPKLNIPNRTVDKFTEIITPISQQMERPLGGMGDYYSYGSYAASEMQLHQAKFLHNIGLRGKGMVIAMLDAGYYNYSKLRSFDSVRINGQILSTWDFVGLESNVENDDTHGMNCFSIISANIPGQFVGKAPQASFHLFRTEDATSEYPIEEHNWACGAERADSAGSIIISSSLGYTTFDNTLFDHTYSQMNGNTCMSSIAADVAARKGMLVIIAAGNDGNLSWHYISAPSDADSALCIGAVNSGGAIASFSSYGPSSDGQVKPDVASVGVSAIIQSTTSNILSLGNGTSFACPNMAGLATCLWQGFPEVNNMRIIRALREAGDIAATPDNRTGYGIPNMRKAFSSLLIDYVKSTINVSNCAVALSVNTKLSAGMQLIIQRKTSQDTAFKTINTTTFSAPVDFSASTFQYTDTIAGIPVGTLQYRIQQVIDTSSSNYFMVNVDTVSTTLTKVCETYNSTTAILINYAKTSVSISNCNVFLSVDTKLSAGMQLIIQRKTSQDADFKTINTTRFSTPVDFGPANIQYTDNIAGVPAGLLQYRIQQDIDTSNNYYIVNIDTVSTTLASACNTDNSLQIKVSPNPIKDNLVLTLTTGVTFSSLKVSIYDMAGHLVQEKQSALSSGTNTLTLPVQQLQSGKYFIRVHDGNIQLAVSSFIKLP